MSDAESLIGPELSRALPAAAALLERAYPAGSMRMDCDYLRWALGDRDDLGIRATAAATRYDSELVGFAASAPVALALDAVRTSAWIVSFVAVAPEARQRGVARSLYARLLGDLVAQDDDPVVLTFAQEGSAGATLIDRCYADLGWHGRELELLESWGALRGRLPESPPNGAACAAGHHELRIAGDMVSEQWSRRDPRFVATLQGGARLLAVAQLGSQAHRSMTIDTLPSGCSERMLAEILREADERSPEDASRIVVPGLPASAAPIARAAGLRRVPGAAWRSWLWARHPDHPLFGAARTATPII